MSNPICDSYQTKTLKSRLRHHDIKLKIDKIVKLYADANITINSNSQLAKLLDSVQQLSNALSCGENSKINMNLFFKALHVERVASAFEFLETEEKKNKYLNDLLNGTLDFFERKPSHAKSILWELEVWTKLKNAMFHAYLKEPDVVVNFGKSIISIPCKKIFSEKGVPKVLSEAVSQIEKSSEFGIVAMNIDDLLPGGVVLNARTFSQQADKLYNENVKFLNKHKRHFVRYFNKSRIIAAIISTSAISDIHNESPKFNNTDQWTIWTVPGLNSNHQKQIENFRQKLMA